jgi:hypothetical protein
MVRHLHIEAVMSTALDIRNRLEEAAVFARAGDLTSAVAHARVAVRDASDSDSRAEASLALERFETRERAWRAEVDARMATFIENERKEPWAH